MRHYQDAKGIRADIPKFDNPYEQQMIEREAYVAGLSFRNFCESVLWTYLSEINKGSKGVLIYGFATYPWACHGKYTQGAACQ